MFQCVINRHSPNRILSIPKKSGFQISRYINFCLKIIINRPIRNYIFKYRLFSWRICLFLTYIWSWIFSNLLHTNHCWYIGDFESDVCLFNDHIELLPILFMNKFHLTNYKLKKDDTKKNYKRFTAMINSIRKSKLTFHIIDQSQSADDI